MSQGDTACELSRDAPASRTHSGSSRMQTHRSPVELSRRTQRPARLHLPRTAPLDPDRTPRLQAGRQLALRLHHREARRALQRHDCTNKPRRGSLGRQRRLPPPTKHEIAKRMYVEALSARTVCARTLFSRIAPPPGAVRSPRILQPPLLTHANKHSIPKNRMEKHHLEMESGAPEQR